MYSENLTVIDESIQVRIINNSITKESFHSLKCQPLHLLIMIRHDQKSCLWDASIQITDKSDPLLLLSTLSTKEDYRSALSFDGATANSFSCEKFPQYMLGFIRKCIKEQKKDSPEYFFVLRRTSTNELTSSNVADETTSFQVICSNHMRHECNLSLNLTPASTEKKLQNLLSYIKDLKDSNYLHKKVFCEKNHLLELEVERLRTRMLKKEKKMNSMMKELLRVNQERENYSDDRLAEAKKELKSEFNERFSELQSQNGKLVTENADLRSENNSFKEQLRKATEKDELLTKRKPLKPGDTFNEDGVLESHIKQEKNVPNPSNENEIMEI